MRNLVRNSRALVAFACLGLTAGACTVTQSAPALSPDAQTGSWTYRIEATSDRGAVLRVVQEPGFRFRSSLQTQERAIEVMDGECPAFDAVLGQLANLPPIHLGPEGLRHPEAGPRREIPPRRLHATSWDVRWAGQTPDGNTVDIQSHGSQGPHAIWLDQAAAALGQCE
jgi:hypothetical protein